MKTEKVKSGNLIINVELKEVLPRLSDEECAGLEASILKEGCFSDLIVWKDMKTIVDGHARYEICQKHNIPFKVKEIPFERLDDAKLWRFDNQKNRRNFTPYQRAECILKLKDVLAAKAKERQGERTDLADGNIQTTLPKSCNTRQELAKRAGVSEGTLNKVEHIIEYADDKTKEKLRRGDKGTTITSVYNRIKKKIEQEQAGHTEETVTDDEKDRETPISQKKDIIMEIADQEQAAQAENVPTALPQSRWRKQITSTGNPEPISQESPRDLATKLFDKFGEDFVREMVLEAVKLLGKDVAGELIKHLRPSRKMPVKTKKSESTEIEPTTNSKAA